MTLSTGGHGTASATVDTTSPFSSVSPAPPARSVGAMLLYFVGNKPFDSIPGTPATYTAPGPTHTGTNGTTAKGTDAGSMRASAFYRVATNDASDTPVITWAANYDPQQSRGLTLTKSLGNPWRVEATTGGDSSASGTSVSVTGASILDAQAGDLVYCLWAARTDAAGSALASQVLTIPGCTVGAINPQWNSPTSIGLDSRHQVFIFPITAGIATGVPVLTATSGSGSSDGTVVFVLVSEQLASGAPPTDASVDPAVIAVTARDLVASGGAITRALDPANRGAQAQSLVATSGAVSRALDPAILATSARDLAAISFLASPLAPAIAALQGQPIVGAGGAVGRDLSPAMLQTMAQELTGIGGAVAVPILPAVLPTQAQSLTAVGGAATAGLSPAVLAVAGQQITALPVLTAVLQVASIATSSRDVTASAGPAVSPLESAPMILSARDILAAQGGVQGPLDPAIVELVSEELEAIGGEATAELEIAILDILAMDLSGFVGQQGKPGMGRPVVLSATHPTQAQAVDSGGTSTSPVIHGGILVRVATGSVAGSSSGSVEEP